MTGVERACRTNEAEREARPGRYQVRASIPVENEARILAVEPAEIRQGAIDELQGDGSGNRTITLVLRGDPQLHFRPR